MVTGVKIKGARKLKSTVEESLDEGANGDLYMTEMELLKLSFHENRAEMNKVQAEKFAMQEQLLQLEYLKNRDVLRKAQGECMLAVEKARTDYNEVRMQVQTRLGINLNEYTVNEAGRLSFVPTE